MAVPADAGTAVFMRDEAPFPMVGTFSDNFRGRTRASVCMFSFNPYLRLFEFKTGVCLVFPVNFSLFFDLSALQARKIVLGYGM